MVEYFANEKEAQKIEKVNELNSEMDFKASQKQNKR